MGDHAFRTDLAWTGSTGEGYQSYRRGHDVGMSGGTVRVSSAAAFLGDATLPNPEELLVAAVSSCQLLSFLAVAATARLDVVDYRDEAVGRMPTDGRPMSVTEIVLRPRITMAGSPALTKIERLVEVAHRECFIAASLRGDVIVQPTFVGVTD